MARKQLGVNPSNTTDAATKTYVDTSITNIGAVTSNTSTSVDSEIALFSSTTGKVIKRATGSGLAKVASGVLSTVTAPAGTVVGDSDAVTLTNKRVTPRVTTITSSATPAINTDTCDVVTITALAVNISSMTTSLSGTPANFQRLTIRIKDNGTARTIAWGASFEGGTSILPTTTTASKTVSIDLIYDAVDAKWACQGVSAWPLPTFDSAGGGSQSNVSPLTWSHTISSSASAVMVAVHATTTTTPTASVGATSMTLLTSYSYSAQFWLYIFGLLSPPTGTQTVTLSGFNNYTTGNSMSYFNVSGFGSAATATGNSNVMTLAVPAANGTTSFAVFGTNNGGTFNNFTQQSTRWIQAYTGGVSYGGMAGDGRSDGVWSSFITTATTGGVWGAVGLPLN